MFASTPSILRVLCNDGKFYFSLQGPFPHTFQTAVSPCAKTVKTIYVCPTPSGSKTGSHPKTGSPLAGTIVPSVRPSNRMGSEPGGIVSEMSECCIIGSLPGPAEYANVQRAHAAFVEKPISKLLSPWCPSPSRKYLM